MKRLVMCALLAGCGMPIPTEGATKCAANVYLEVGVGGPVLDCAAAMSVVRTTLQETGIDVTREAGVVEFMAGETLESLGHPNAWGATQAGGIAVSARHANTLIHEAYHLHDGGNGHCNWSVDKIPTFERNYVAGSFDDACRHVHCSSTVLWSDSTGQFFGNRYVCTPIP